MYFKTYVAWKITWKPQPCTLMGPVKATPV